MPPTERTLYQFPVSHYCEKARWLLDAKGLPYQLQNLMPGPHRRLTKRMAQASGSVPVLVDGTVALGDSTEIALHLERTYPTPPLLPPPGPERDRVLELEDYFDGVGIHVRRWAYGYILDGGDVGRFFFGAYAAPQRWLGRLLAPVLKSVIRRQYRVTPTKVEESRVKVLAAMDRIESETQKDPSRYLVGSSLTLADITAAALLGPLLAIEGTPYAFRPELPMPKAIVQMAEELRKRPAGQWALRRYQEDRHRVAAQRHAA
ncbi:glutathione S-transferase family protein [Hyalangium versicolor]|uniref:glutathione S-transferase family protein n=1 Tax=Hyalangium versicolor TaxID=2861190 RepID=UPI001CCDE731|nr:glutathione S-transferase [Hyalangium versicolor]